MNNEKHCPVNLFNLHINTYINDIIHIIILIYNSFQSESKASLLNIVNRPQENGPETKNTTFIIHTRN